MDRSGRLSVDIRPYSTRHPSSHHRSPSASPSPPSSISAISTAGTVDHPSNPPLQQTLPTVLRATSFGDISDSAINASRH